MKETNKNFIYNVIYQIFIYIIPLITIPYISRKLGAENIGIFSYTYSIVNYFMLFALLGINNYGARTIAKLSYNKQAMERKFWSIYYLQLFLTIIMTTFYLFFVYFAFKENRNIMFIQTIFLLSVGLDINWFFFRIRKI